MLLQNPSTARAQWYDRNLLDVFLSYNFSAIAPHGVTTRWSYTVPAGRKTAIEMLSGSAIRQTVAAPVGTIDLHINMTPSGGGQQTIALEWLFTNVVGDRVVMRPSGLFILQAGDQLVSVTSDSSTGGTAAYITVAKGSEFDA